ncbi:hypothetical protein PybrP1_007917 [[Pythium] brassicae (nom. inval.)]|nr:hypothetical protein PybrP1_007917 [[Pythium] brassicae (nom. inval.)]
MAQDASSSRKRKMQSPSVGGLARGNKFVRPNPNSGGPSPATGAVVPQQGSIHTSDAFIDHQRAMFHADTAPTPFGPVANMPPTPAFGNRNGGFSHTPDGFDSTPTDDGFPSNSSVGPGSFTNQTAGDAGFESDAAAAAAASKAQTTTPSPMPRAAPLNLRNFANWNVSSRYTLVRLLGKGSYGQVAEAFDSVRQTKVAIKKIHNVFDQEIDCKRLYREIYILRHLSHPQVIHLVDVIPPENYDSFSDLYLVFDFLDTDLHKLIMSPQYLTIRHIQIADFGLSRVMESDLSMEELAKHLYSPKDAKSPTTSDATSPGSASSTPSSSNGSQGDNAPNMQVESCPRYQERVPLFPGRSCFPLSADRPTTYSDKLDQLNVIFTVIGTPNEEDIGALGEVKQYLRKLPKKEARDFREMYPGAPADALDLLKQMLSFNPECRISVDRALDHPFLQAVRRTQSETVEAKPFGMEFENVPLNKDALKARIFDEIKIFAERNNR